jgi:hypothetical protein
VFLFSDAKSLGSFLDDERTDTGGAELRVERGIQREQIPDGALITKIFLPFKT